MPGEVMGVHVGEGNSYYMHYSSQRQSYKEIAGSVAIIDYHTRLTFMQG